MLVSSQKINRREEVIGQRQPQHGGHKQQQKGVEAPGLGVGAQVAAGIDQHQRADAQDHERKEQAQSVEVEREATPSAGAQG